MTPFATCVAFLYKFIHLSILLTLLAVVTNMSVSNHKNKPHFNESATVYTLCWCHVYPLSLFLLLSTVILTLKLSTMRVSEQFKFRHAPRDHTLALRANTRGPVNSAQLRFSLQLLSTQKLGICLCCQRN